MREANINNGYNGNKLICGSSHKLEHNRTPLEDSLEPSRPLFGPPAAVAARLREYVDAGFSTVIVEVPAPYDVETLERLIGEVKPLVDAGPA